MPLLEGYIHVSVTIFYWQVLCGNLPVFVF